jgi:hypothetical protein
MQIRATIEIVIRSLKALEQHASSDAAALAAVSRPQ